MLIFIFLILIFLKFSADFYFFNAYFVKSMPIYKKINYATFIQSKLAGFSLIIKKLKF